MGPIFKDVENFWIEVLIMAARTGYFWRVWEWNSVISVCKCNKKSIGSLRADFDCLSDQSRRRRTESIRDSYTTFELLNAA